MKSNQYKLNMPTSAVNASFFLKRTVCEREDTSIGMTMAKMIEESKKLMGLDPNRVYLTDKNGVEIEQIEERVPQGKQEVSGNKKKYCTECGTPVVNEARFCSECGNKF